MALTREETIIAAKRARTWPKGICAYYSDSDGQLSEQDFEEDPAFYHLG